MGFVSLIIIALLILLADVTIQSQEQTNQTCIDPIPSAENSLIIKAQFSTQLVPILLEINSIKNIVLPCLEDVRNLCRKLGRVGLTSWQRRRIETIVSHALEGKEVLWKLKVRAVREKSCYFYPGSISPGGFWVEPMIDPPTGIEPPTEWSPTLRVQCQTFKRDASYLQRGESVVVSGRIAKVELLWSSFILIVSDAVVSRSSQDKA
jgi:hypothetical protein